MAYSSSSDVLGSGAGSFGIAPAENRDEPEVMESLDSGTMFFGYLPVALTAATADYSDAQHHQQIVTLEPNGGSSDGTVSSISDPASIQFVISADCQLDGIVDLSGSPVRSMQFPAGLFSPGIRIQRPATVVNAGPGRCDSSKLVFFPESSALVPYVESLEQNGSGAPCLITATTEGSVQLEESSIDSGSQCDSVPNPSNGRLLNLDLMRQKSQNDNAKTGKNNFVISRKATLASDGAKNRRKKSFAPRCETCDEVVKSVAHLRSHARSCQHCKQFLCERCGEGFNQRLNFELHLATHSTGGSGLQCPACGRDFSRLASYKCHLTLHRIDDLAVCDICHEEFSYYTQLKKHVRIVHNSSEPEEAFLYCKHCGLVLEDEASLKEHRSTHRKIRESMKLTSRKRKHVSKDGSKARGRPGVRHECSLCGKTLSSHSALQRHKVIHTGQKPYACSVCGKKFSQKGSLMFHQAVHATDKPFSCQLCGAGFTQRGNLRKHVERLHPANVSDSDRPAYRCPLCSCVFRGVQPLNVHMSRRHGDATVGNEDIDKIAALAISPENDVNESSALAQFRRSLTSDQPESSSKITSDLLKDALTESGLDPILSEANEALNFTPELSKVEKQAGSGGGKQLAEISQKLLKRATAELLKKHTKQKGQKSMGDSFYGSQLKGVRIEMENGRKYWYCPQCSRRFTRGSDLVRHMRRHSGERPYSCAMCGKSYTLSSTLQQHLRFHLGINAARCYICLKSLSTSSTLRKHMKLHNRQPSSCAECGESFLSAAKLKSHIRKMHKVEEKSVDAEHGREEPILETECGNFVQLVSKSASLADPNKPNRCSLCPAAYKRQCHLQDHMKTAHGGGPSYRCRQCGRLFLTSRYLRDHLKRHSGRKPFACTECPKSFVTASGLRRHSVVHSDRKPFLCPFCGKRFKRGVQCRKHIRTVHKASSLPHPDQLVDPAVSFNQSSCLVKGPDSVLESFPPPYPFQQECVASSAADSWVALGSVPANNNNTNNDLMFSSGVSGDTVQQQLFTDPMAIPSTQEFPAIDDITVPGPSSAFLDLSCVIGDVLSPGTELESAGDSGRSACNLGFQEVENGHTTIYVESVSKENENSKKYEYACYCCGSGFGLVEELVNHLLQQHNSETFEFPCPICHVLLNGSKRFSQHVDEEHGRNIDFLNKTVSFADNQVAVLPENGHPRSEEQDDYILVTMPSASGDNAVVDRKEQEENRRIKMFAFDGFKNKVCLVCKKSFKKTSDLERHFRIHTGEKPFPCSVCGKRFRVKSTLTNHMKTHWDEVPYNATHICQVCNKDFMSRGSLKVHLRVHTNEKPYECEICSKRFRTSSEKRVHIRREHNSKGGKQKRPVVSDERESFALGSNPVGVIGNREDSAFRVVESKLSTMQNDVSKLALSVRCDADGVLQVEVRPVTADSKGEVVIEVSTLQELAAEGMVLNVPLNSTDYATVSQVTVDPVHLLQSLQLQRAATSQVEIVEESREEAESLKNFIVECRICEVNFGTPEESEAHFLSEDHETAMFTAGQGRSDRKFPCQHCVKSFENQWKLDRHVMIHTRLKPFVCDICKKSFNQKNSLLKHRNGVHANFRLFKCEFCGKDFQHKCNLTRHWRNSRCVKNNPQAANTGPVVAVEPQWGQSGAETSLLLSL